MIEKEKTGTVINARRGMMYWQEELKKGLTSYTLILSDDLKRSYREAIGRGKMWKEAISSSVKFLPPETAGILG